MVEAVLLGRPLCWSANMYSDLQALALDTLNMNCLEDNLKELWAQAEFIGAREGAIDNLVPAVWLQNHNIILALDASDILCRLHTL